MIKTKKILIALAVIGANVLHNMPLHTALAEADYTIKQGSVIGNSGTSGSYTETIKGNTTDGSLTVTGGSLSDISYSGNEVIIHGGVYAPEGTSGNNAVAGANNTTSDALSNNTVNIYGGTFKGDLFGANSTSGVVSGNIVNIYDGTLGVSPNVISIYGGYSISKDATGNLTYIEGGTFASGAYIRGGGSISGNATGNTLSIKGGTFTSGTGTADIKNYFYGGESNNGSVTGNTLSIEGGTFSGTNNYFYGGHSINGIVGGDTPESGNKVIVNNGIFDGLIYGGKSDNGTAKNNSVTINNGMFATVYGGNAGNGGAAKNTVTINDGTFSGNNKFVYGGVSGNGGDVTENKVTVKGGIFTNRKIMAGFANNNSSGNDATGNIVNIEGGTFDAVTIYGGLSNKRDATGNKVNIEGGTFSGTSTNIYGGYTNSSGNATGNIVNIESGSFTKASNIYGGYSGGTGIVSGNTITIKGGNFEAGTSGNATTFFGGKSNGGLANNNIVNIEDGNFGEYCYFYGGDAATGGTANNNIVNVTGGTFADNFAFFGGWGSSFSGNVLNLKTKINSRASVIQGFSTINFTLPADIANGDTMLKTTRMFFDTINKTTINVYAANGVILKKDDVITLIDSTNAFVAEGYTKGTILGGAAELVNKEDENKILQIVLLKDFEQKASGSEDKQKAPVEGIAASVQMVNQSADLASGDGMKSLIAETAGGETNTFAAITTGSSKYKTGSHVDVDGWGFLVGAGKTKEWGNGEATSLGIFFEFGKGDFDTYNGSVHGDGNSENKGIGLMMRHKMMNNTYYEGHIRYGKQETEWGESDIGSYDTDSRYYGISVGIGHVYQVGKNEIDVYGRYTYGHVGACDATVGTKEYHFDSVKSHRVRVGGKYNFKQKNSNAKPYIGIAWEHEFKGETRATISGVGGAPAPSMKGNTGILEAGCDWNVSKKWTVGLGANAYVGKRKGWDGMARVFYNF